MEKKCKECADEKKETSKALQVMMRIVRRIKREMSQCRELW